jgi:hypothetical protein
MPNVKALALPLLLTVLSGCVVETPRAHVAVAPPAPTAVVEAPPAAVIVREAPPAPVVEEVPPPRPGYVWVIGHWRWNGERHVWVRGHWEGARVGYHYVQPHWDNIGGAWRFSAGVWVRG